jgi:hypothetical protein
MLFSKESVVVAFVGPAKGYCGFERRIIGNNSTKLKVSVFCEGTEMRTFWIHVLGVFCKRTEET